MLPRRRFLPARLRHPSCLITPDAEETRMRWLRDATLARNPTAGSWAPEGSARRDLRRAAVGAALVVLRGYCLTTAWTVLGQLGMVKLADCRHAFDAVSVRDAVLCILGYKIGIEFLRAVTRRRSS